MLIEKMAPTFSERIANDGFALVSGILSQDEIEALASDLKRSDLPRSRAGIRHAMRDAKVAAVARDVRLLDLVKQTLGAGAIPFRATLFDKSPAANWLVVWHQDTALPLRERRAVPGWGPWSIKDGVNYAHAPACALEQVLALRLHLDDSTAVNGPLRVLPRTQMLGVLTDEQLHDLSTKLSAADCLVPRGGVVAMRPLIVHASSKSQSDKARRVLHIEYAASAKLVEGLELAVA